MATASRSTFVGRDADLAAVRSALTRSPIVTLTGPPGVGKTRLALEVAGPKGTDVREDVAVVRLAGADSQGAALQAIGREVMGAAAGRPTFSQLAAFVGRRSLLLILDDLDRVHGIGAALPALVADCPHLRVLATCRERFHLSVEREYPVPPLATPTDDDRIDVDRLLAVPTVQLLVERAGSVAPDFRVDSHNAAFVAALCRDLDGLPLAYELVAPYLKAFSARELDERLGHRFALAAVGADDVPTRHRTLRTAIGWSHDLLPPPTRALLRRASLFAGPWTAEDAVAVCLAPEADRQDVHAELLLLVDRSLLQAVTRPDDVTEYQMLDSIRAFAVESLEREAEGEVATRHTAHFTRLARYAEARFGTREEDESVALVHGRRRDLETAGTRSLRAGDLESAAWLAAACGWAGYLSGVSRVDLVQHVLDLEPEGISPAASAAVHTAAGVMAYDRGDSDAERHLSVAAQTSAEIGDLRREAIARAFCGHVARQSGRLDEAETHYRAAGGYFASAREGCGVSWNRYDLGLLARDRGHSDEAIALLRQAVQDFRDLGYLWATACSTLGLATVLSEGADAADRRDLLLDALEAFRDWGDSRGMADCIEATAQVAAHHDDHAAVARLLGAAARLLPGPVTDRGSIRELRSAGRKALGDRRAQELRTEGQALPVDDVIALVRSTLAHPGISPRERQVAGRVADGETNRQIGRALGITERTVETHVAHVMDKLDVRSRAEIAAWAARRGLGTSQ